MNWLKGHPKKKASMITLLKWKFVGVIFAMFTLILLLSLGSNYLTSSNNIGREVTETLTTIAEQEGNPYFRPWDSDLLSIPYFSIEVLHTGHIISSWDEYYNLTETDLLLVATAVLSHSDSSGTLPSLNLRFVLQETLTGYRILCSDLSLETRLQTDLLYSSLQVGSLSLVILCVLSFLLANHLIRPVEQAWSQQKQFVADASHELKTPLTVILSSGELLSLKLPPEENSQRWLENIHVEGKRMQRLIEDMLTLTRLEGQPQGEGSYEQVDFSRLVEHSILLFEPIAFEKQLLLQDSLTPHLTLQGNPDKFQQLLSILLDNSIKYSPAGQVVQLTLLKESSKHLLFQITNPCDPLTPTQCTQLFHRFYRQDASRSLQKGYGLGLSIAHAIVTGSKGKIWAEYKSGALQISVRLPLR